MKISFPITYLLDRAKDIDSEVLGKFTYSISLPIAELVWEASDEYTDDFGVSCTGAGKLGWFIFSSLPDCGVRYSPVCADSSLIIFFLREITVMKMGNSVIV